jgi:biopolymer transport protein ExbD
VPRRRARRALSLTPLVDVIFLLLLFFLLGSTFARYGEVEIAAGGAGAGGGEARFLQIGAETLRLGGRDVAPEDLPARLGPEGGTLLLALAGGVGAQRLVDVLAVLRRVPSLDVTFVR